MNHLTKVIVSLLSVLALGACSTQWREADAEIDSQTLFEMLDAVESSGSLQSSGAQTSLFHDLVYGEQSDVTAIYFADAPGPIGPAASVLSFYDLGFISSEYSGLSILDVEPEEVRVFFLDGFTSQGERRFVLVIQIREQNSDSFRTSIFEDTQGMEFSGEEVIVRMQDGSGQEVIALRSYDVDLDNEEFKGAIQLRVDAFNQAGEAESVGKISTLAGFGG